MYVRDHVLDFDGVMADSPGAHFEARLEAYEAEGYGDVDLAIHAVATQHGSTPNPINGWVLKESGIIAPDADPMTDPTVLRIVKRKNEIFHAKAAAGHDAVEGVLEHIDWLVQSYGIGHLAIATTASIEKEVNPFIRRHDLGGIFKVIVGKEDTPEGRFKPDPYVYTEAVARLGTEQQWSMATEDHPLGIRSAKAAGLMAVGITTTTEAKALSEAGAFPVGDSFSFIQRYLISMRD